MRHIEFSRLVDVIEKLRDPKDGCPWDLKQTHESLLKFLIEESYEYIHAVELKDKNKMVEELGDVLLQVVLHAVVSRQEGSFTIDDVCKGIADKLIRRHPHVFKEIQEGLSPEEVLVKWQAIKREEKKEELLSLIDESYLTFPALFSANKIGKKTNEIKFDWQNSKEVQEVVESEWQELKIELDKNNSIDHDQNAIEEELGDLLFSLAQLGRHLNIDSEEALRKANRKFLSRFQKMEKLILDDKKDILKMNQKEMDLYWAKVKKIEKGQNET